MDVIEAILTRRSIRKYTKDPVPESLVKELLQAAMAAPSAKNEQPWHFIVINDHKVLDEIPKYQPYTTMLPGAVLAILVCAETNPFNEAMWVQDCSAATENLLIAANAKGLGAVWLGMYPFEAITKPVQKLLNLPDNVKPLGLVSIGYPAEEKPPANRFKPERVHLNKW